MAAPSRIIQGLPEFSWRKISAPYATASFDFAFDLAERLYYGVDVAAHDNTGRRSSTFPITLLFLNTLEDGLFPDRFNAMLSAVMDDKTVGDLRHPIMGDLRARVVGGSVKIESSATAGGVIDVSFVETREEIDVSEISFGAEVSPEALAVASDDSIASLGVSYPQNVEAQQQPADEAPTTPDLTTATSFLDAYNAIKGNLFAVTLTVTAALNQLVGKVELVLSEVSALDDPGAVGQRYNLLQFWYALKRLQKNAERVVARSTAKRTIANDTTLDIFAREVGNSLSDVMSLNVQYVSSPLVKKGSVLRFYKGLAVKFPAAA